MQIVVERKRKMLQRAFKPQCPDINDIPLELAALAECISTRQLIYPSIFLFSL